MPEREKVIKGLEVCTSIVDGNSCPKDCPYYQEVCYGYDQLMRDALALIKEQDDAPQKRTAIVRCAECRKWDSKSGLTARMCAEWGRFTTQHEFCSRGAKCDA